ncbi:alpha/beta hydrolase family protein [Cellulomonas fimi]|uniref:Dienelactone hydrolase n=1 Tax=Cellulomonas fimi (strain ATCC 484 / DSM 20113 / JCM 1341 / CCUG 24087 / LMG 16345 / NBRC 15513 / NCIMB 8980 / NCTC 7547 / NRS-133) TaxID=590998 RepID=F4H2X1_CELFA|nr:acyl-CoA thioester hydrolase/BAAT C-terminal domain-containing protein [Cellulomonas fimi]AEE46470.1 dienelactone hydrolase [Cellulomonas fimi ATCC 484]NNH08224.1 alpha/beta hydrolase fold domain-containing protein [Cellulomonas fimi]VEH33133.1 Alpha/beta hydrolase family [Cellulomonas fimi]
MLRRGRATRAAATEARAGGPYRVLASTALGVVLLAVVGAVTGPRWDPVPLTDPITVATSSTAIGDAPPARTYEVRTSVVTVQLDGASVRAQISEPVGLDEPAPGVVFVHGAGTGRFAQAFVEQARALAASGVVAMVPDKRLDTYTTRHRDYVEMAADYARSVALLRTHDGVDPERVGLYAESEGGWIAPVMAAQDPALGFVVLVSSPVVPPREQAAFAVDSYLRNTGVPHGVFRAIPRAVGMSLPGGGFEYADFDVTPYQRAMTQPVLVVYGTGDASMPTVQGAERIVQDTALAGNGDVTVRYYEGANHGIRVDGDVSPRFLRDLSGWVRGLPATAASEPRIAGAQPVQTYVAAPVPEPRWLRDGDVVIGTVAAAAGLVVLAPLLVGGTRVTQAVAVRLRRTGEPEDGEPRRPPARFGRGVAARLALLGSGAVATVVALVVYLVAIARLALDYERNDWVVQGGWLAVRVLGIAVVVGAVLLARRVHRLGAAGEPVAPGVVRKVAGWAVVVGSAVLLAVLAYWGVFQLGI